MRGDESGFGCRQRNDKSRSQRPDDSDSTLTVPIMLSMLELWCSISGGSATSFESACGFTLAI